MDQTYTLTLSQAGKILAQLKGLHSTFNVVGKASRYGTVGEKLRAYVEVKWSTTNPLSSDEFLQHVADQEEYAKNQIERHFCIVQDVRRCKDVIFKANVESGITDILSDLELAKDRHLVYSNLFNKIAQLDMSDITANVSQAYRLHQKRESEGENLVVNRLLYTETDLHQKIAAIKKNIRELEARRDNLNSATKVTIVLHSDNAELVGL